ncbi:MAG: hypothetical protein ACO2ZK_12790, partial [Gemmobacter sp.]
LVWVICRRLPPALRPARQWLRADGRAPGQGPPDPPDPARPIASWEKKFNKRVDFVPPSVETAKDGWPMMGG